MDTGQGEPAVETLWLSLTPTEAREFRDELDRWLAERPEDPGWHSHGCGDFGRILTVDVMEADDPRFPPSS